MEGKKLLYTDNDASAEFDENDIGTEFGDVDDYYISEEDPEPVLEVLDGDKENRFNRAKLNGSQGKVIIVFKKSTTNPQVEDAHRVLLGFNAGGRVSSDYAKPKPWEQEGERIDDSGDAPAPMSDDEQVNDSDRSSACTSDGEQVDGWSVANPDTDRTHVPES